MAYSNADDKKRYNTGYYLKNREAILKKIKKRREEYPEQEKQSCAEYSKSAKGIFSYLCRKSRAKGETVEISRKDFIEWYDSQEQKCFYCGRNLGEIQKDNTQMNKTIRRFQIDRIDSSKGYVKGNIVLACPRCNMIKNNFFTKNEMLKIVEMFPYKF
jgi:hypothetical protein